MDVCALRSALVFDMVSVKININIIIIIIIIYGPPAQSL